MIIGTKIKLRRKGLADAPNDYTWCTDRELAHLDACLPLAINFSQYRSGYAGELCYPSWSSQHFAIETLDGTHIGNCSCYNIDEVKGEAELGIMIGNRDYWDKGYGTDAVTALIIYTFREKNLKRIHLKTLESNTRAQKCFRKCGFTAYGHLKRDGYNFVLMELDRNQWEKQQTEEG